MDFYRMAVHILDFCTFFNVQLLVLSLLFCLRLARRKLFWVRFTAICLPYLAIRCFVTLTEVARVGWFSGGFILCFLWVILLLWYCFQTSLAQAFFFTTFAYTGQHLLYWLKVLLEISFFPSGRELRYYAISFLMMAAVCLLFYFVFVRRYEKENLTERNDKSLLLFSLFMLLVVNVLSQFSQNVLGETQVVAVCLYGILSCILLLLVQFRIFEQSRTQREKEIAEQLLYASEKQQHLFKESLDVINLKCHDLKHQIAALKKIDCPEERRAVIEEVEGAIIICDAVAKTGNETLDVVLTEKSLQAEKYGIRLACIADGKLLHFLSTAELASFFGNLLDNAIESVKDAEPEKRDVFFSVEKKGEHVWIHEENWCGTKLDFRDGFPVTQRGRDFHGFGVLSLRLIADKYRAELRMEQRGEIFYVDALFPFIA